MLMRNRPKVYGGLVFTGRRQRRTIVAATSQRKAARRRTC